MNRRLILLLGVAIGTAGLNGQAAPIHDAVKAGDTNALQNILAGNPACISQADDQGKTPLRLAVDSGSVGCLRVILNKSSAGYVDPLLDSRQAAGQNALKDGTLAKANEMLGKLVRLDPASENINFAYGLSWLSLGDSSPAGAAFDRILLVNPANYRARIELARARIASKRYRDARKEIETILAADLPEPVRQTVQSCLKDIQSHTTRFFYSGNVELGCLYDSNVNIGPNSDLVSISPISFAGIHITELQLSEKSKPTDTTGISAAAGVKSYYDIGEPDGWLLTADANCYRNWLKESDYDTASIDASLGFKRVTDKGFFQAPVRARYIEYGGDPLAWTYGLYPTFAYAPSGLNGLVLITMATAELRDFHTFSDRDGNYVALGEIVRKTFAQGKTGIYGGIEVQHDQTRSTVYEYNGTTLLAGGDIKLPWRLSSFAELRYSYRTYKDTLVLAPEDRKDNQYMLSAGISRDIANRFTVSLVQNIINNDSTFDLYEYRRHITTLSTSFKF